MKSKIEKIENNIIGDGLTRGITAPTNQQLMEKINELVEAHNRYFAPEEVDHLNSQDQEEECRYFNGDEPIKDKETIEFMKGLPDRVWEDTPEEWEDRIRDLILDISADRLVSSEKVVAIVQSLLDDREREVVERIVRETRNMERLSIKQGIKGDKAMKRLRGLIESLYEYKLLNSKKK